MYTRRRYNNRGRGRRRYGGYKRKPNVWKINRDVNRMKQLVSPEWKYVDTVVSETLTSTPVLLLLNGTARGDEANQRDGREIRCKSIQLNLEITIPTSGVVSVSRIVCFLDLNPAGSAPAHTDVYQAGFDNTSLRALENRKRFIILGDWQIHTVETASDHSRFIKWYRKINMNTVCNSGNNGTIADIQAGAIYLMMYDAKAADGNDVNGSTRVRFLDS